LCGEFGSLLIKLAEAGDLPSQPPVVKVFDVMLQVHKIAAGPDEEGVEPGREWLDGVFLAVAHCVSLCIQIDNVRGLIGALHVVVAGDLAIFQSLNPLGGAKDSITDGDVEVMYSPIVLNIAIGGSVKHVFVVLDMVVEPVDLLLEVANFAGLLGVASGNGCEEPLSDGSKDVHVEIGVGCQGGCNCIW
jgi:hypothetical protein